MKSNNNLNWGNINIQHDENCKPFFENYNISISHSGLSAISIAYKFEFDSNKMNKTD